MLQQQTRKSFLFGVIKGLKKFWILKLENSRYLLTRIRDISARKKGTFRKPEKEDAFRKGLACSDPQSP